MYKHPFIFFILGISLNLCAQNDTNACLDELFSRKIKPFKKENTKTLEDEAAAITRQMIDSLNYTVVRDFNGDGKLNSEWIYNDDTGLCLTKYFHDNGMLMSVGYATNNNTTLIGLWKYYKEGGDLDSTFNYDIQNKITFCDFYKEVEAQGFAGRKTNYEIDLAKKNWTAVMISKDKKGVQSAVTLYMNLATRATSFGHEQVQD